jgi:hypothetical protein
MRLASIFSQIYPISPRHLKTCTSVQDLFEVRDEAADRLFCLVETRFLGAAKETIQMWILLSLAQLPAWGLARGRRPLGRKSVKFK